MPAELTISIKGKRPIDGGQLQKTVSESSRKRDAFCAGGSVMAVGKLIFQTLEGGGLFISDVIEYEGKLWLVPEWLTGPTKGTARPARIICLDGLPLSKPSQHQGDADWALSTPLSTEILEGRKASQNPLVIERPDIFLRVDTDFHR